VLEELFYHGDFDALDELIHPDFINHEVPPGHPQGRAGLRLTIDWLRGLWGPLRPEIEDVIAEADKVVARVTMHGHHVGEFMNRQPTGRPFAAKHIHSARRSNWGSSATRRDRCRFSPSCSRFSSASGPRARRTIRRR
jgi:predicted ester cyclase